MEPNTLQLDFWVATSAISKLARSNLNVVKNINNMTKGETQALWHLASGYLSS